MKIELHDREARVLLDRLHDEQPGSQLNQLRAQIEGKLEARPGQPLSADELDLVVSACHVEVERLKRQGNPSEGERQDKAMLGTAIQKLEIMRQRQRRREQAGES